MPAKDVCGNASILLSHQRGQVTILDQEGVELADRAAAEIEAAQRAQKAAKPSKGTPGNGRAIIVVDENWERVFEVLFLRLDVPLTNRVLDWAQGKIVAIVCSRLARFGNHVAWTPTA